MQTITQKDMIKFYLVQNRQTEVVRLWEIPEPTSTHLASFLSVFWESKVLPVVEHNLKTLVVNQGPESFGTMLDINCHIWEKQLHMELVCHRTWPIIKNDCLLVYLISLNSVLVKKHLSKQNCNKALKPLHFKLLILQPSTTKFKTLRWKKISSRAPSL